MKQEIIFVSKIASDKLFKSPIAHIDNNPLVISRYNPRSGKQIDTKTGNDLSKLVSTEHADYYFVQDRSIHDLTQLDPVDITRFVLANSDKCLNRWCESDKGINLVLFDFIMEHINWDTEHKKVKSFF